MQKPKKILTLVVTILSLMAFAAPVLAQEDQEGVKKRFEQAVDRLACLVALESVNTEAANNTKAGEPKPKPKTSNDCDSYGKLIEGKKDTEDLTATVLALKNTRDALPQNRTDAIIFFLERVLSNDNPDASSAEIATAAKALKEFGDKPTRNDKNLENLRKEFEVYLKNVYRTERAEETKSKTEQKNSVATAEEEASVLDFIDLSPFVEEILIVVVLLGALLLAWVIWNLRNVSDAINDLDYRIGRLKDSPREDRGWGVKPATRRPTPGSGPMIRQSDDAAASRAVEDNQDSSSADLFGTAPAPSTRGPEYPKVVYLPSPTPDGWFNDSSKSSSFREGTSIYRFELRSENDAEFEIHSHREAVKSALLHPERNIEKVCTSADFRPQNAVEVITEARGRARREGDRWVVIQKARVRYGT